MAGLSLFGLGDLWKHFFMLFGKTPNMGLVDVTAPPYPLCKAKVTTFLLEPDLRLAPTDDPVVTLIFMPLDKGLDTQRLMSAIVDVTSAQRALADFFALHRKSIEKGPALHIRIAGDLLQNRLQTAFAQRNQLIDASV